MAVMRPPLSELSGGPKVQDLLAENHLEVTPLAYIRGRSLQRVFFIVDEAQNLNPHEIKTIITRAGEGTNWTAPVLAETERFCNPKRERGIVPNSLPRSRFLKLRDSGPEGRHILCRWREPPVCDYQ